MVPAIVLLAVMARCCWIASCNPGQRFGSLQTGRYRTDFNALSLERTPVEEHLAQPFKAADRIFGVALPEPAFRYHVLAKMDDAANQQYRFWRSVFGSDLHGRLYFFVAKQQHRVLFDSPVELDVRTFQRLKTFFIQLDDDNPSELVQKLEDLGRPLPDWFDKTTQLCLRLPVTFAYKFMYGSWSQVCVPDPATESLFHKGTRQRSRLVGWSFCPGLEEEFPDIPERTADPAETLTADAAGFVVDTIRQLAGFLSGGCPEDGEDDSWMHSCERAAQVLQNYQDDLDPASFHSGIVEARGRASFRNLPYQARFVIQCMLLSYYLRDAGNLRKVLQRAVQTIMPASLAEAVLKPLEDAQVPSASKMSKARLTVDVAYMLFQRQRNLSSVLRTVRYVMVDSSVQGHHDFELIRVVSLDMNQAGEMRAAAERLRALWPDLCQRACAGVGAEQVLAEAAEATAEESVLYETISRGLETHLMPSVVIGGGHATLWHKYHAVMHAFFLESGDALLLADLVSSIFSFTTDQGVEFGLSRVPVLPVRTVFPWIELPQFQEEHDWAPGPDIGEAHAAAMVDLTSSVSIPGMLHIVHNSTNDLGKSMRQFETVVNQMQHVSKLLRRRDSKQRLLETYFADNVGRHLHAPINSFTAKIHTGRWGSVSECVKQMLEVGCVRLRC